MDRQNGIIDKDIMSKSSGFIVGVGRSLTFVEWFAASGASKILKSDPQRVSLENVGLSGFRCDEIGERKVEVAARRVKAIAPNTDVEAFACKAEEIPDLLALIRSSSFVKIGIDDTAAMFKLADIAQDCGTDTLVVGTQGDNKQFFVAGIFKGGPSLYDLLPEIWAEVCVGRDPPEFYPSCRLHAETLNLAAFRIALGLLHYRGGSSLSIAETGRAFVERPLLLGLNGIHAESGFVMPMRLVPPPLHASQAPSSF